MNTMLLLLAIAGMIIGIYSICMPTLTRRGWRLPFGSFFGEADAGEDEPFKPVFDVPGHADAAPLIATPATPGFAAKASLLPEAEDEQLLPPVIHLLEDDGTPDPTLEPLFAELETAPEADTEASEPAGEVRVMLAAASVPEAPSVEEQPEDAPLADDMMAFFAESGDEHKGPSALREAVGDVTIEELMAEVRNLQELFGKRTA